MGKGGEEVNLEAMQVEDTINQYVDFVKRSIVHPNSGIDPEVAKGVIGTLAILKTMYLARVVMMQQFRDMGIDPEATDDGVGV
jgi:hypothetical protein